MMTLISWFLLMFCLSMCLLTADSKHSLSEPAHTMRETLVVSLVLAALFTTLAYNIGIIK
jgi:hypothetical protein